MMPTLNLDCESSTATPAQITKSASKQTYYTIRFLVDRNLTDDAYRAYAYFRWLDDWIDQKSQDYCERILFVERQKALIDCAYQGDWPSVATIEEQMVVELIRNHPEQTGGLHAYIQNMLAVMDFDSRRRGQLVSQKEL